MGYGFHLLPDPRPTLPGHTRAQVEKIRSVTLSRLHCRLGHKAEELRRELAVRISLLRVENICSRRLRNLPTT